MSATRLFKKLGIRSGSCGVSSVTIGLSSVGPTPGRSRARRSTARPPSLPHRRARRRRTAATPVILESVLHPEKSADVRGLLTHVDARLARILPRADPPSSDRSRRRRRPSATGCRRAPTRDRILSATHRTRLSASGTARANTMHPPVPHCPSASAARRAQTRRLLRRREQRREPGYPPWLPLSGSGSLGAFARAPEMPASFVKRGVSPRRSVLRSAEWMRRHSSAHRQRRLLVQGAMTWAPQCLQRSGWAK